MTSKIYPYKGGSRSAKLLAEKLGCKVLRRVGSKYVAKSGDVVINWGSSVPPIYPQGAKVLNSATAHASNKRDAFIIMQAEGVLVPAFWTQPGDIPTDAFPIVCRKILNGSGGAGIVIANSPAEFVEAPLYVRYIKKQDEYRVHCFRDNAFYVQRKARKHSVVNPNWLIRNLEGGFVFVDSVNSVPAGVVQQALAALEALKLDFGAVDVIYNNHEDKAYVLEVNTAPGLEERTALKYAEAFKAEMT